MHKHKEARKLWHRYLTIEIMLCYSGGVIMFNSICSSSGRRLEPFLYFQVILRCTVPSHARVGISQTVLIVPHYHATRVCQPGNFNDDPFPSNALWLASGSCSSDHQLRNMKNPWERRKHKDMATVEKSHKHHPKRIALPFTRSFRDSYCGVAVVVS